MKKKVLIAYDGSDCAKAAIEDLKQAGLPKQTEALVVSVADVFLPPETMTEESIPEPMVTAVKMGWQHSASMVKASQKIASEAAQKIRSLFPSWKVKAEAFADSPSWGVIKRAREWKADLIVVGAHGFHATGRLALGSLSQLVATQAPCSVRIVHANPQDTNAPSRIVIGMDGSAYSYEALNEVASREWKKGSAVHLITVSDPRVMTAIFSSEKKLKDWIEKSPEDRWARRLIEHATHKLEARGLTATSLNKEGDAKKVILEEARRWGADCIFVGSRGLSGILHLLLGSVSSSLAARADCAVEIVRTAGAVKEKIKSRKSGVGKVRSA